MVNFRLLAEFQFINDQCLQLFHPFDFVVAMLSRDNIGRT